MIRHMDRMADILMYFPKPKNPKQQQRPLICKHDRKKRIRFVSSSALVQCLDDNKVRSLYQKLDSDFRQ